MSNGDILIPYRQAMRQKFICLPLIQFIAPDRPAGENGEMLFQGLDGNWLPTFSGRTDFTPGQLQCDHEVGHETIDQLVARGLPKVDIGQLLFTRRGWGSYAQQKSDLDNGLFGKPGTMNYWMNDPNEMMAESVRCSYEGPIGPPGTSAGNPGRTVDWGHTINHAEELAWWQQIVEDKVIKLWIGPDQPVVLDSLGDTPKPGGQVITIPAGQLSPGVVTQGFAQRIGIAGTETGSWGTAEFVVDSSGTSGRLHVRGGFPKPGLSYYRMSAEQKI